MSGGKAATRVRTPGDDLQLNNAVTTVANEADEHEARIKAAVAAANAAAEIETQNNQVKSQRQPGGVVAVGSVVVPAIRRPEESKYGRELPYPHGTPLNKDRKPVEGNEETAFISARVMGPQGWLCQRAVPIEQIQGPAE